MTSTRASKSDPIKKDQPPLLAVHNEDIALAVDEIAELLALTGENPFRIRAYRRAAQVVRSLPQELAPRIAAGFDPDLLPGIGADLANKIRELVSSGHFLKLDQLRRSVPAGLRDLLALPGIGPQRARALHKALNIQNLSDLRHALASHQVRKVAGFGAKSEARLQQALDQTTLRPSRIPRHIARQYGEAITHYLTSLPGVTQVTLAGSYRRGCETVGDLDIVMCADRELDLSSALSRYSETSSSLVTGPTRCTILLRCGLQVDIRLVAPESYGAALYYFTGSKAHNIHVRRLASSSGLKINEYGVYRGRTRIAGDSEISVFSAVGLPFIEAELREDRGEIAAGLAGHLPALIERSQLLGDLHVHTGRTDGTATIDAMSEAAQRAGLQYIAITDHAKHIGLLHGLDATALTRQIDEIDAYNASQNQLTVLKGIEADVLADGTLSLPDHILKQLDLVVAAVHDHFDLPRRKQTDRLLRMLDNRYISILAHPSTRLLTQRNGIDCNWNEIFLRAAQRPCYLELNSQPSRLDLDDIQVREAAAQGILISIASDAHGITDFANLDYGLIQGRRGWLTSTQVLNTRPLTQLRKLLRNTFL